MSDRVLFTSTVQPIGGCSPNVYSWNKEIGPVKIIMSFINHPGLSFLGANLSDVDILEYPTWNEFQAAIQAGVDVLGLSFYINETELALQMVDYARKHGVREIIAGNYGAYSPEVAPYFDQVITGWGEAPAAVALGQTPPKAHQLIHPPMFGCLGTNAFPQLSLHGFLYTSRGCPCTCTFCQTPDFYGKAAPVPLEAIDRVLWEYRQHDVVSVNILDENFGIFPQHTREVLGLLRKYRLRWMPLCRVDLLLKNLEEWVEYGLYGVHVGVESLNADSLSGAKKKIDRLKSVELLRALSGHNLIVQAFYIIGFEEDTVESVQRDIKELSQLDVDLAQVQILTPYPKTPLRTEVENEYGILDRNLSRYNSRNLVWQHPAISPEAMRDLQVWANRTLFSPRRAMRTLRKVLLYDCTKRPTTRAAARMIPSRATSALRTRLKRGLRGAKQWSRRGWDAYEEVPATDVRLGSVPAVVR